MNTLVAASTELSDAVARVSDCVAHVRSRRSCGASGVVWGSDLVVTSARSFEREEPSQVVFGNRELACSVIGVHAASDLLVLRAEGVRAAAAPATSAPRLGELVFALAHTGERLRARLALVSAAGAEWRLPGGVRMAHYIETALEPLPELQSSALFSVRGELLGVNVSAPGRRAMVTLPAVSVDAIVRTLNTHGRVLRAHLGVAVQAVRLPRASAAQSGQTAGLMVMAVLDDSAAERAGVLLGDVLLELAGRRLTTVADLEAVLGDAAIGSELALGVMRAGAVQALSVRAEERSRAA